MDRNYTEAVDFITKVLEENCASYCCDEAEERRAIAEEIVKAILKESGLTIDEPEPKV